MEIGLALFIVTIIVNALAQLLVGRSRGERLRERTKMSTEQGEGSPLREKRTSWEIKGCQANAN